jgi:hypothetical protein
MIDSISCLNRFHDPSRTRPPEWVHEFLEVVAVDRPLLDSATVDGLPGGGQADVQRGEGL